MLVWRWSGLVGGSRWFCGSAGAPICGLLAAALQLGGLAACSDDAGDKPASPTPAPDAGVGMMLGITDAGRHDAGDPGDDPGPVSAMDGGRMDASSRDAADDAPPSTSMSDDFDGGPSGARRGCVPGADNRVGTLDLLFVIDNSGSMAQEQAALTAQFPRLVETLGTSVGAATDIHLGVVSSDMGLVGISDIDRCSGLGDDGILQNVPRSTTCAVSYPSFLTYQPGQNTAAAFAQDFSCIASLGTDGCGFEQQLESGLKALWPSGDRRIMFLGDVSGMGMLGHADTDNAGFVRSGPPDGPSVLAVVVVSDEEDCSSKTTAHFTPASYLDPNDPADALLLSQGLNVRCHGNPLNLYEPRRYIDGLRALRPGNEDLVVFAAIVGVPPETVGPAVLARTNFEDPADRAAFYRGIQEHPLMQPTVDDFGTPDPADDNLKPSCESAQGKAYPPNRIVQVAEGFGRNGMVQSICEGTFGIAIDAIITLIGRRLKDGGCL